MEAPARHNFSKAEKEQSVQSAGSGAIEMSAGAAQWSFILLLSSTPLHWSHDSGDIITGPSFSTSSSLLRLVCCQVPIRCQDVAVYFSMEEWEYLEGHEDRYKEVMMEDPRPPRTSHDGSSRRNPPQRCPLYSQDCPEENVPDSQQGDHLINTKVEIKDEVKEETDFWANDVAPAERELLPRLPVLDEVDENSQHFNATEADLEDLTTGCGSSSGRGCRTGGHAGHRTRGKSRHWNSEWVQFHSFEESEKSGGEDYDLANDESVVDRTWQPAQGDNEMTSEEEDIGGGGDGDLNRRTAPLSKKPARGRPAASLGGGGGTGRFFASAAFGGSFVRSSPVWEFFCTLPNDKSMALCKICKKKISRGRAGTNVGTTSLRTHMKRHHQLIWQNRIGSVMQNEQDGPAPPHDKAASTASTWPLLSPSASVPPSSFHQTSIKECLPNKQQYASTHPMVRQLNLHLTKLLAVQSLPYHFVESIEFQQLMACAQPRWRIPSPHYFSKKAIPSLYHHVSENVGRSLDMSVWGKVHITIDTWSSNYGPGQYMAIRAHWVNVLNGSSDSAQMQQGQELVLSPPRLCRLSSNAKWSPSASSGSSSLDYFQSSTSPGQAVASIPSFHGCKVKRCHAVLQLISLDQTTHTAEELLCYIQKQISCWLSPHQLYLGSVVSDSGTNIVNALQLGKITHCSCMAHVLNLVVRRFINRYSGLKEVLLMARKVSAHFSRSYVAKNALLDLQRQNGLPLHRLICDVPTRWNSTLHMLERLCEQQKAVNDYCMQETTGTICYFEIRHWRLMREVCRLLKPFEEATKFVSRENCSISDVIPLIYILQETLTLMQQGMEEEQQLPSFGSQEQSFIQQELEVDEDLGCGVGPGTQRLEEEEDFFSDAEGGVEIPQPGEETDPYLCGDDDNQDQPWQATGSIHTLASMAGCMLHCLHTDKHSISIKQKDEYWIAVLLDPRYKSKMGEFFPASQREEKLAYYQDRLSTQLAAAFRETTASRLPGQETSVRSQSSSAVSTTAPSSRRKISSSQYSIWNMMNQKFFTSQRQPAPQQLTDTHRLHNQVQSYLDCSFTPEDNFDPMEFWASKLDKWQELAQFAMGVLSCPASSVKAERVFSAANGGGTPRRTKLSITSEEKITFVKMNRTWIGEDFQTPLADASE
ncbi:zinc finger BED domain-containing protein 6-like [Leptodactylus fuscus]|uniref:zinc finger BED domain-containing protein 6-like n=1 Tax=Leptodactylus fuscus TaxID=238119 RepID=UPI003F4E6EFC